MESDDTTLRERMTLLARRMGREHTPGDHLWQIISCGHSNQIAAVLAGAIPPPLGEEWHTDSWPDLNKAWAEMEAVQGGDP